MGRGFMFLPMVFLKAKLKSSLQDIKNRYNIAERKLQALALTYVATAINRLDPVVLDRLGDELVEVGDNVYTAVLHIKRTFDVKYASRFFQKETIYEFDGNLWVNLWEHDPTNCTKFNLGEYKKRIPRGDKIFVIDVQQVNIENIVLQVIHNEDLGYISLGGDMAFQPTKYFKRL
jgi:hypothetical protein